MIDCPQCRQPLSNNARFCHHCGLSLSNDRNTLPHDPATVPTVIAPTLADDPLLGRALDSKYQIIARIGAGGMGSVYRARRVHIGDEVAVKVLLQSFVKNTAAIERFRREARAAAMLHHPNVVTIHDYGESSEADAPAYIVMELVAGRSLRDMLEGERRLSVQRAVELMRGICAGVGAAHRNHIVHRDIKPDNIIVQPPHSEEEPESVKVLDFGIAKLRDMAGTAALTQTGAVIGTPYYMSPEQCKAEHLDSRSDVYSLGAMMYEMLAGSPPFTAATATGIVAKHLTETPPPLPVSLRISSAIEAVIMRALAKDPQARQSDAAEFSRELQSAMLAPAEARIPPSTRQAAASELNNPSPAREKSEIPLPQPARKSSRAGLIAIVAAIFIIGILGVVIGLRLNRADEDTNKNTASSNVNQSTTQATNRGSQSATVLQPQTPPDVTALPTANANRPAMDATEGDVTDSPDDARSRAEAKILAGERLSASDIEGLSQVELRLLRNTVYARHGRVFAKPEVRRYFSSRSWYTPRPDYSDSDLTAADQANIRLILDAEKNR